MTVREQADVLVLGAGFAGALMALVAQRLGLRVVLLEKGRHPRFAIGESSTPIANLVLEGLAHGTGRAYHHTTITGLRDGADRPGPGPRGVPAVRPDRHRGYRPR